PDQFGNIRNVKELSSVANQFDRHRTLSETYGAAGWELTFDDMKRLGDWEFVLGVNFMNQHLSYISMAGDRKHDFPQSFGTHSPYWGVFRYQTDYFARLSLALSSGFQRNNILIIEPTTTAWMYYNLRGGRNLKMIDVKKAFEPFLVQLEKYQVEYDLGCENIIKDHGKIEDGKFVVNKVGYELVILPPGLENLDKTTFKLLKQFVEEGGKVMQINSYPQFVNGDIQSFSDLQNSDNWEIYSEIDNSLFTKLSNNKNIQFENLDSIKGNVFHQRREFENGQLLFVTNFDKNETAEIQINMQGKSVLDLNTSKGIIKPYTFVKKKGRVHFSILLPPSGSQLLFISTQKGNSKKTIIAERELLISGKSTIKIIEPNVLNIDYVELTMAKFKSEPMYFYSAGNEIWKEHGYPDNPWVSSSQFKTELVDADTFAEGTGFEVCYPFFVDDQWTAKEVKLVVERPWLYTVTVNGADVTSQGLERWMDPDFHVFEISELVKKGRNEVVIKASPFSIFCELEPVYLLGDFGVISKEKGWIVRNSEQLDFGSWKSQGMPFYGQTVAYTKTINAKVEGDFIIRLPEWKGTVVEVKIDGKHHGIIQSEPNELKVRLPYGMHEITVIVNGSNKNILGPHHNVTRVGIVTPWSFKVAPEFQPPGNDYDLLDYGLMKDFEVYKLK
ncbi:MAG: hypothetical protein GQ525_09245, partial [Draconibacterium sp.]|nr:hypothetical protein [Draconibacterium sp.]